MSTSIPSWYFIPMIIFLRYSMFISRYSSPESKLYVLLCICSFFKISFLSLISSILYRNSSRLWIILILSASIRSFSALHLLSYSYRLDSSFYISQYVLIVLVVFPYCNLTLSGCIFWSAPCRPGTIWWPLGNCTLLPFCWFWLILIDSYMRAVPRYVLWCGTECMWVWGLFLLEIYIFNGRTVCSALCVHWISFLEIVAKSTFFVRHGHLLVKTVLLHLWSFYLLQWKL